MNPPVEIDDELRAAVAAERAAQGFGPTVTDPAALNRIRHILDVAHSADEARTA